MNAAPFGDYDFGASISSMFLGGGSPSSGVAKGDTALFEFAIDDFLNAGTSVNDFINAFPAGPGGECCDEFMVVRFRGDAGSDKVPTGIIPEPATLVLFGSGLFGLRVFGRKKKLFRAPEAGEGEHSLGA